MKIKVSCDSNETMNANLILTKHDGICDNELTSLIVTEFGKDRDDPKNWVVNIPIFEFNAAEIEVNIRTGTNMGIIDVSGTNEDEEEDELLYFQQHVLRCDSMTVDDLKSINAIVMISHWDWWDSYQFCVSDAKFKYKPKINKISVHGHFKLEGFNLDEFVDRLLKLKYDHRA